jgi:hypothetical protein
MSKERRVDPQVTVGLLTTGDGFPLGWTCSRATRQSSRVLTRFRDRALVGIKDYVNNTSPSTMDGRAVVAAYHDLYQVERSFRMTKVRPGRTTGRWPGRTRC